MTILDSGFRRAFESGAVRDIGAGKGRCDLIPLDIAGDVCNDKILRYINDYIRTGNVNSIVDVIQQFSMDIFGSTHTALLEVSKQYEDGANKYDERNWEKGLPVHCYVDSGVRHYLKHLRGDEDEPHARAFLWNMYGLLWTHSHKPKLIDLPFKEGDDNV